MSNFSYIDDSLVLIENAKLLLGVRSLAALERKLGIGHDVLAAVVRGKTKRLYSSARTKLSNAVRQELECYVESTTHISFGE